MTPETDNAIRAACRRCTEEIQQAMRKKPKSNWKSYTQGGLIAASEQTNEQTYRTGWSNPQQNRR